MGLLVIIVLATGSISTQSLPLASCMSYEMSIKNHLADMGGYHVMAVCISEEASK